ncbi:MAG: ATP-binding protein [Halopenitus sp.]
MKTRDQSNPAVLIITIGVLLFAVAASHHWEEALTINQGVGPFFAFFLDGSLAVGILYAGYWLSKTDLTVGDQWTVWWWSLGGAILSTTLIGLTILIRLFEGRVITEPTFLLLIAVEVGALAGLIAGYNTARARRAAERAREANERLETLSSDLRASNKRLEQFASTLSHDLREPLRMVSNYVQLLERQYGDDLDEDAREFIGYAVDGADRMQSMIDSLLEYSRVTTDEDLFESTDADAVLNGVLEDLQIRIEETNATVTADELPTVRANREQLEQVFRNLIENAIQHSGDDPPQIHVGAEEAGDEWRFVVRDEGVGIDPAYQDQIFEMFEQIDGDDGNSGTAGMGLALCERIVDHHGGEIRVESDPGDGTTFTFTLPMASESEE